MRVRKPHLTEDALPESGYSLKRLSLVAHYPHRGWRWPLDTAEIEVFDRRRSALVLVISPDLFAAWVATNLATPHASPQDTYQQGFLAGFLDAALYYHCGPIAEGKDA